MGMPSPLPMRDGVGATRLHVPLTGPWLSASYWSPPEATSSVTVPVEEATVSAVSSDPAATR